MEGTRILIDGLDYTQVKVLFDAFHAGIDWKDTLMRLQVMEIEAVSIWNLSE